MKKRNYWQWFGGFVLTLLWAPLSFGQPLTQAFQFNSGAYRTFSEFQQNKPAYTADEIEGNFFVNQQTKQAKVEFIKLKDSREQLNLDSLWGIVIKGKPYVRAFPNMPEHHLPLFAGMEVRGNICYYAYDDIALKKIPIKVYNPLLGRPFRTQTVERKVPVIREKMLRFQSGEVADFNYYNLLEWLEDDAEIVNALRSLGEKEAEDKIFDALLLYNQKYPVDVGVPAK